MAVRPAALDEPRLLRRLEELAQRGALPSAGITRLAYGTAWSAAHQLVGGWMREAGMLTRRDAAGNLFGRIEGSRGGRVVVVGSHLDTVRSGGALDGALGIVAAIESLDALVRERGRPQRIVEAVAIADHEGGRFGLPAFGARAIAGRLERGESERRAASGVSLGEALRAVELDPGALASAERLDIDVFIELHIEQGATLDRSGARLAVATAVTGSALLEVRVGGQADHAAATFEQRRDALVGASTMVLALDALAMELEAFVTVGELAIEAGQSGVVPARLRFTVDVREIDAARHATLVERVKLECQRIAHARDLVVEVRALRDLAPRALDVTLSRALVAACESAGATAREMVSPAAHDAAVLAAVARTGLLFVPSVGGRSHRADEATAAADVLLGARALTRALGDLLY